MDTLTQQLPPSAAAAAAAAAASSQLTPISPSPPRRKSCCLLHVTSGGGGAGSLVSFRFPRKNLSTGGGGSSNALMTANFSHLQQQQQGVSSPASNSFGDSDDDFDAISHEQADSLNQQRCTMGASPTLDELRVTSATFSSWDPWYYGENRNGLSLTCFKHS